MYYDYEEDNFNLSYCTNEELRDLLYEEMLGEDLYKMCKIILKELPKKYKYRIISKLHRVNHPKKKKEEY